MQNGDFSFIFQALRVRIERMEAQTEANNRLSSHKRTTHLLQTELLDSGALVNEKEGTIQSLNSKLQEYEVCVCVCVYTYIYNFMRHCVFGFHYF